jgi:conjugal transfer/entry exclusion protein
MFRFPNKGENMFGLNKQDDSEENKNKIEQLEDKVEELENKIANIYDVLEIQEDESFDDSIDEDSDEDSEEE